MTEQHLHAVRFYQDSASLCLLAGNFLADGLLNDRPAIIIATPAHLDGIKQQLAARGLDVESLASRGELVMLDAEGTLAKFMRDGSPDAALFTSAIGPVIQAARGPGDRVACAYGEMVDVLWAAGQTRAASRLERLWNDLARTHAFALLCGYAIASLYRTGDVDDICSHHSHVLTETGDVAAFA
jgi:hypothetical protein